MAFKYGQSRIDELIEKVEEMRDSAEVEQLATYVANVDVDKLTDAECTELGIERAQYGTQLIGYEQAGQLSHERLRELFEQDDWGPAWEMMDSEKTEYFEQDEGRQEALNGVLDLLRGTPPRMDQVCTCGHWFGEHNDIATRCNAPGCGCTGFEYDAEASTPQAIADRGGDPEKWPEHVKKFFAEQKTAYTVEVFSSDGTAAISRPDGQDVAHVVWVDRTTAGDEEADPTWRELTDEERQDIIDRIVAGVKGES